MISDPDTSNAKQQPYRVSGYRIDRIGIHDRYLPWRHFGFWKYARSVRLKHDYSRLTLVFIFEGRKRPLKIQFSNTFKNTLKAAKVLELGLRFSSTLVLEPNTRKFLEKVLDYQTAAEDPSKAESPEQRLTKAELLLEIDETKAARREVKKLLETGGKAEEEARLIRLQSFFIEGDDILAKAEYNELGKRFPDNHQTKILWAIWNLLRETNSAESYAREVVRSTPNPGDKIEVESHLSRFLIRKRRYDEALTLVERLLADETAEEVEAMTWLQEAKAEIEKLKTDAKYNRQQTFWRPLRRRVMAYAILGFIALALCWPAIRATPRLIEGFSNLRELEQRGQLAQSGEFNPKTSNLELGFVRLSFIFSLSGDDSKDPDTPNFHSHYGNVVLRKKAAKAILANTKNHSVVYLPESPFTCTIYPITKEVYIGVFAKYMLAYFPVFTLLLFFAFYGLKDLYNKYRYRQRHSPYDKGAS